MSKAHPLVNFIFFCIVIGFGMVWQHPVCLAISLLGASCYSIFLFGGRAFLKGFFGLFWIMLLTAIINPAFSHQGVTVLCELPTGNVLTLESICYGVGAAVMLALVLMWFRCMSEVLTSDHILYLFGKMFPVLSLLLSMALSFVPKVQRKLSEIRAARPFVAKESLSWPVRNYQAFKHGISNLSILVTWIFEDAMDMADSMRSRGYGLEGRTAYVRYRFTRRDGRILTILLLAFVYLLVGGFAGATAWYYYPNIEGAKLSSYSGSVYMVYMFVCMLPLLLKVVEERRWNKLQSRI